MLVYVTEVGTNNKIAINSKYVVAVLKLKDGEQAGKTLINMTNGQICVEEEDYDVVAQINNG
jgi:hypothetical protein